MATRFDEMGLSSVPVQQVWNFQSSGLDDSCKGATTFTVSTWQLSKTAVNAIASSFRRRSHEVEIIPTLGCMIVSHGAKAAQQPKATATANKSRTKKACRKGAKNSRAAKNKGQRS